MTQQPFFLFKNKNMRLNEKRGRLMTFLSWEAIKCPYFINEPIDKEGTSKSKKYTVLHKYTVLELHEILTSHSFLYPKYMVFCANRKIKPYDVIDFYYWASIIYAENGTCRLGEKKKHHKVV